MTEKFKQRANCECSCCEVLVLILRWTALVFGVAAGGNARRGEAAETAEEQTLTAADEERFRPGFHEHLEPFHTSRPEEEVQA